MARNWTPAQSAAMSTLGRTLLISAAAGSGKTATLTERIIRRLTDPEHPADLSRMLIVTFTRAAAAELRERIAKALSDAIAADPANRHLQKQYMGLGGAHISTIDAFCREPVKAHFAEIGLPAVSRIADDAELKPLCERVMGDLIDEYYIKYASKEVSSAPSAYSLLEGNPFADLCDSLTPFKNDTELIPTLQGLYNRLLSFPEELGRLNRQAAELADGAEQDFFTSAHGGILREWIREFCSSAIILLEEGLERIAADPAATKAYDAAFRVDLEACRAVAEAQTYAQAQEILFAYNNLRLGQYRGGDPDIIAAKDARTTVYQTLKKLRDTYFIASPAVISAQMRKTAVMCSVLYDFLSEYDRRILAEKKNRGICDFTDNRRYLLSLLRNPDGTPSAMALEYGARYDEVYIDEYQDVDEMQDEIFRLIGQDHRFMVGDIKQSIYVFRGADPSVFAGYRRMLPALDTQNPTGDTLSPTGNSIFMSENFRCDESVIRVTNAVCGHIFRACPDTVGYRDEDDLGFSKLKPTADYTATPVQVTVLTKPPKEEGEATAAEDDGELAGVGAEAAYVAGEISRLLRTGKLADGSPIRPKDVVILMRGRKALSPYMEALAALGIPTGSEELEAEEAGRDLLHGSDMSYLVNLLRVIDNPDHDIPLSEVLRAPFPGLTLEELVTLRNEGDPTCESQSLYANCEAYVTREDGDGALARKLTDFLVWLEHYRSLTATQPADGILRLLRRDPACASRESAAFLYLYESARTCRTAAFLSLCVFLRYFESKLKTQKKAPVQADDREGGHVTIMTIHNSKGLEFPVCFVVRCGQAFIHKNQSADLLFDKRAGVAMKLYSRTEESEGISRVKTDTVLRQAAALSAKLTEREEEMRLLYVAMTRARERLYLVGMGNEKPVSFRAGDRFATMDCGNYMKWILAGLDAHPEAHPFCSLTYLSTADVERGESYKVGVDQAADPTDGERAAYYRSILDNRPLPDEAEGILRHIPTTLPASRMTEHLLDTCVFLETDVPENTDKLPDSSTEGVRLDVDSEATVRAALNLMASTSGDEFELLLSAGRRPTAAERGTAAHLFLQYCDYGLVRRNGLEEEISRLAEQGFLSARTAEILDRSMLEKFFNSRFFLRMTSAVKLERELKFNRMVPLSSLTAFPALAKLLEGRSLMVRGSVDLLCEFEDGHLELCDYKTDHITEAERKDPSLLAHRMTEQHRDQLLQYAAAITELYGKAPTHAYIFSLPLGEAVEIPL